MRHIFKISIAAALSGILASCSFFDVTPQVISGETFYTSEKEAQYGLAGVYGAMSNQEFYGEYYSLSFGNIDDLSYFNRPVSTDYSLQYNLHSAGTSRIYEMWSMIYKGVSNANYFMEAISKTEFDPDGTYYNEARFLRAYYYFILGQAWGDVPLIKSAVKTPEQTMCPASPQYEVLTWAASEMEECIAAAGEDDLSIQPSRVTKSTMDGILARVYLFLAGESVQGGDKTEFLTRARDHAKAVIETGRFHLNPDYEQVFKNMIGDKYDTEYHESMWEVEFRGDHSGIEWSNGRIGDILGLQSGNSASTNFDEFNCNFAYGMYNGSLQLWNLYWKTDLIAAENESVYIWDDRLWWNLPPYNYAGNTALPPYGSTKGTCAPGIDPTPYSYKGVTTTQDVTAAKMRRNCGKFRRDVEIEGMHPTKNYTSINYPLLRYADVLLMYAEASNELSGPTQEAYDYVKAVRSRSHVSTRTFDSYDQAGFRQLIRNERGRELCFESLRRFDLIRWGIYVEEMNAYAKWTADPEWVEDAMAERPALMGANTKPMHVLLPIPSIELGVNTELKQNSLWAN